METSPINRPWQKKYKQGTRYNPDPFYQSTTWKKTRAAFILGTSILPNGKPVSNSLCYDCMAENNKATIMHTVDHMVRKKAGGDATDHSNLRSLCSHHHAVKSAKEGNELRKK